MLVRLLAVWIAMCSCGWQATAAPPSAQPTHEQLAASRNEVIKQIDAAVQDRTVRKSGGVGDVAKDVASGLGRVVVLLFRFAGAVVGGIFDGVAVIVSGIGNGLAGAAHAVKLAVQGGPRVEPLPPGTPDQRGPLPRAGDLVRSAAAVTREAGQPDYDWRIPGGSAAVGPPLPGSDTRPVVRLHVDPVVSDEIEKLGRQCGEKAAGVAGSNDGVVKSCIAQVRRVREACSRAGRSLKSCQTVAEQADDACEIEETTEFFLDLAAACHAHTLARR